MREKTEGVKTKMAYLNGFWYQDGESLKYQIKGFCPTNVSGLEGDAQIFGVKGYKSLFDIFYG